MNTLFINGTDYTPTVNFDPEKGIFEISGESRPENARSFYEPIIKWLEEYSMVLYWKKNTLNDKSTFKLDFKFQYFNSTSAKYILDIFYALEKMKAQGYKILINWYYEEGDNDIQEAGEEFLGSVDIPYKMIPFK